VSRKSPSRGRKSIHENNAPTAQSSELSRHLVRAQEEERKRISRELHDGTGQGLMVLRLYLEMLAGDTPKQESHVKVQEALELLDRTIEDLRRIIGRLSPRTLEELGLMAAIRKEVRELGKNTVMKAHLDLPEDLGEVDHEIEITIYRSVQEALHNVAKHAHARNFTLRLENDGAFVCLQVEDDGIGFAGKTRSRGRTFGLLGMRERIAALGGTVRIRSRKGRGTRLRVMLPLPRPAAARKQVARRSRRTNQLPAGWKEDRSRASWSREDKYPIRPCPSSA
jgi:signal transduction histidine kinase